MPASYHEERDESLRPVVTKHIRQISCEEADFLWKRLDRIESQFVQFFEEGNLDPTPVPSSTLSNGLACSPPGGVALRHDGKTVDAAAIAQLINRCSRVESLFFMYSAGSEEDLNVPVSPSSSISTVRHTTCSSPSYTDKRVVDSLMLAEPADEHRELLGYPIEDDWSGNDSCAPEYTWTPHSSRVHSSVAYFRSLREEFKEILPDKEARRAMLINAIRVGRLLRHGLSVLFGRSTNYVRHVGCGCPFCYKPKPRPSFGRRMWSRICRRGRRFV